MRRLQRKDTDPSLWVTFPNTGPDLRAVAAASV
jgi:hypothetical protein